MEVMFIYVLKNKAKDLGRLWMKIMDKLATVGVTKR